ncbi:MAG: hypothetical protein ACHQF0_05570 [Chitinophagales bacterium]
MKSIFFCLPALLAITLNSFSQVAQKKEMQKAKTDTIQKTLTTNTVLPGNIVKATPITNTSKTAGKETQKTNSAATTIETKKDKTSVIKETTVPVAPDFSKASLLDAFFTLGTGVSAVTFPVSSGDNKDPDTHWSCGVFDQNGKPVASFHDDSNTDEYAQGSKTGPLQMHIDNPAIFRDFSNGGHLHINIAPNGNDTWVITYFTLTLDFSNPKFTQTIKFYPESLTQDHRDDDLYFVYDGKDLVPRQ